MPSIRTRIRYQGMTLETAEDALASAAAEVAAATTTLSNIETGTLDLDAVKVGGVRFINSGGSLVAEP